MAVVAGVDKPTAAHYNGVQSTINTVLSTYWGQALASSQIALPGTSTKITSTAWANLRSDILKANRHIYLSGSRGSLTNPTVDTKVAAADLNAYETMANDSLSNYLVFPNGHDLGQVYSTGFEYTNLVWGRTGRNTLKFILRGTFATNAAARYFYNSGGQTQFYSTFSAGTTATPGTKGYSWKSAVNEMGTLVLGANSTSSINASSPGTGSAIGWYQLNTSDQLIFSKTTSTYTPNIIKIFARTDGNPSSTSNYIYLTIEYEDLNDPGGTYTIDEDVGGTIQVNMMHYCSTGTGEVSVSNYRPSVELHIGPTVLSSPNP